MPDETTTDEQSDTGAEGQEPEGWAKLEKLLDDKLDAKLSEKLEGFGKSLSESVIGSVKDLLGANNHGGQGAGGSATGDTGDDGTGGRTESELLVEHGQSGSTKPKVKKQPGSDGERNIGFLGRLFSDK